MFSFTWGVNVGFLGELQLNLPIHPSVKPVG